MTLAPTRTRTRTRRRPTRTIRHVTDADEAETEEEVSDETPEDAESESEPARSRRRVRLPSLSVTWKAAAILLICAFVGASGYMMWQRHEITEHNQRIANFLAGPDKASST